MKRFKGTKGKWHSGEDMVIYDENGFEVTGVAYPVRIKEDWDKIAPHWGGKKNKGITYVDVSDEETIANRDLIATAPELLRVLIGMTLSMKAHPDYQLGKNQEFIDYVESAEQAINKALKL